MRFVGLLRACERRFAEEYRAANTINGLTRHRFEALAVLQDHPGIGQRELAARTGFDRSTLSQMLAELERLGLIERTRVEKDLRNFAVQITTKGRHQVTRASKVADEAEACVFRGLSPTHRVMTMQYLKAIVEPPDANAKRKRGIAAGAK